MASRRLYAIFITAASSATAFSPSLYHHAAPPPALSPRHRGGGDTAQQRLLSSSSSTNAMNDFDDFADFSSTQLAPMLSSSYSSDDEKHGVAKTNNGEGDDIDPFLASLQSRVREVREKSVRLPLMILDTMLPRQVLQIQIQHPTLKSLMRHRVGMETPTLGMLGMARISTGQTVPLKVGVEVEIVEMDRADGAPPPGTDDDRGVDRTPWDVSLRAGRRFIIEGDVERMDGGWTEARVRFLDSSAEEEEEVRRFSSHPGSDGIAHDDDDNDGSSTSVAGFGRDRLSVARAISKSGVFTKPNMKMKNNASLVDRWIELARQNERHPGQIDALLRQLGEIPPEHEPTERAFWIGALINPLPSMGVAMEIRPALLLSKSAEERVEVALDGILKSIRHMDGTSRMW
ncbi:hypothetical protein ACHAXA_011005 [Cyclostephanos tholiformis]|uniref:Lon N-terminal domain-containing protein n=1 Tax=Cyclostephanos tholiformis TaxID=382380 RepID=A0ABD3RAD0_9STRA